MVEYIRSLDRGIYRTFVPLHEKEREPNKGDLRPNVNWGEENEKHCDIVFVDPGEYMELELPAKYYDLSSIGHTTTRFLAKCALVEQIVLNEAKTKPGSIAVVEHTGEKAPHPELRQKIYNALDSSTERWAIFAPPVLVDLKDLAEVERAGAYNQSVSKTVVPPVKGIVDVALWNRGLYINLLNGKIREYFCKNETEVKTVYAFLFLVDSMARHAYGKNIPPAMDENGFYDAFYGIKPSYASRQIELRRLDEPRCKPDCKPVKLDEKSYFSLPQDVVSTFNYIDIGTIGLQYRSLGKSASSQLK